MLFFDPLLAGVFSSLEGLNTRKTRVFALPRARKKRDNSPQNPRKIRGFGWETSVFARFGYVFGVKNLAKPSENVVFPAGTSSNTSLFMFLLIFRAFGASWGAPGAREDPQEAPEEPRRRSKGSLGRVKLSPGAPQEPAGAPQEAAGAAQEPPKSCQERPKRVNRGFGPILKLKTDQI